MGTVDKPRKGGPFSLLPCGCGADEAGYQEWLKGGYSGRLWYRVKCPKCGQETSYWPSKQDAQTDWNARFGRR